MFYGGVSNNMRQRFVNILQKYVDCQVIMFSADDQIKFAEKDIASKGCYEVDLVHRMKLKSTKDAINFTNDFYNVKRKVEIGHFYCDQRVEDISLDYLDNFKFSDHDELILFIDDYSTDKRVLNIEQLVYLVESRLQRKILVAYESEMLKYSNQTLEYLYANFIIKHSSELTLDKVKLKRHDKPTCFLLSLTWTLFRSGYFQEKEFDVLTIISTRYQKLENKVYKYLPDGIKKRVQYVFF